jgi:hypothetical protein
VAACNGTTLRLTVQNGAVPGNPFQEYWYEIARKIWHGPHTFPASMIAQWNNTFVMTAQSDTTANLYQSDSVQSTTSSFTEPVGIGGPMSFTWYTSFMPDSQLMVYGNLNETTAKVAYGVGNPMFTVSCNNPDGAIFDTTTISNVGTVSVWGTMIWGSSLWGGTGSSLGTRKVNWHGPIVFDRIQMKITGTSAQGIKLGDAYFRYEPLGYTLNV